MLRLWVEAGRDPSHFWGLTYREIDEILEGNAARLKHEHNQRAWLAWHIAMMERANKLPRLDELLIRDKPKRQSIDQMVAVAKSWSLRFNAKG